jgi:dTDP-4-dehydrorhamnose 3,5-epimerase-like enzyme
MIITEFKSFSDERGDLLPVEFKNLPFIPIRIFIVKNASKGCRRGGHAHFKTWQLLICLKGRINVFLHDGSTQEEAIIEEGQSVLIENLVWDYQDFLTDQDVLLVLCSTLYNEKDYITDFDEFLRIKKELKCFQK